MPRFDLIPRVVVDHRSPEVELLIGCVARSQPLRLPDVLARDTRLPVAFAVDGEELRPGRSYVAPPNFHLLVRPGAGELSQRPHENGVRLASTRCSGPPPGRTGRGSSGWSCPACSTTGRSG